jgi:hypothetical protein
MNVSQKTYQSSFTHVWQLLTHFGNFWQFLAIFGNFRQFLIFVTQTYATKNITWRPPGAVCRELPWRATPAQYNCIEFDSHSEALRASWSRTLRCSRVRNLAAPTDQQSPRVFRSPSSSSAPPQLLPSSSSTPPQLLRSSASAPPQLLLNARTAPPQKLLSSSPASP